ncbi:MAG: PAS domain S-box protein [Spirochaetales bacterium]|nr:PAS domain S-box protein [Spirochaetales bacterium]
MKNQERLDYALEAVKAGVWDWSLKDGTIYFDSHFYEIAGYEPYEFPSALSEWEKRIHPNDLESSKASIDEYVSGNRKEYDIKFRFLRKNGSYMCIQSTAKVVERDDEGNPVRFIGIHLDITERNQSERKLRESEGRFRGIAECMSDWIWEVDAEGRYTYCSDRAESITGYSAKEIIGKTPFDFIVPEEIERVSSVFSEAVLKKESFSGLQNWSLAKNGKRVCLLTSGTPIFDDKGVYSGYRGTDSDITAQKTVQDELRKSEIFQRSLLEALPDFIFVLNNNGIIQKINRVQPGHSFEEVIGKNVVDFIPSEFHAKFYQALRQAINENKLQTLEAEATLSDGKHYSLCRLNPVSFADESSEVVLVNTDITGLRKAELALVESEERLNLAMTVINDGVWDWNLKKNTVLFDNSYYTIAGYEPDEFPASFDEWEKRVHPEDLEYSKSAIDEYLAGNSNNYNIKFRFRRKDGSYMWIKTKGKIVTRDEAGNPLRFIGTHHDITNRKNRSDRELHLNMLLPQLLKPGMLKDKIEQITSMLVSALDADLAQIWLYEPNNQCKQECIHYATDAYKIFCKDKKNCLHLISSSGRYTHIDGELRRLPGGGNDIGVFFTGKDSYFTTNTIITDSRIHNQKWAIELGLKSFSAHRLTDPDGGSIGVMAVFSKNIISPEIESFLKLISNLTSQVIINSQITSNLEDALSQSDKVNNLMEGRECRVRQLKEEINSLYRELGKQDKYNTGDTDLPYEQTEISLIESRENALNLAEDAEIARREAVDINEQLSTIKQAVNSSSDAVAISTVQGDVFYLNNKFSELFGYSITEMAILPQNVLFEDEKTFETAVTSAGLGKPWNDQVEMASKNGRRFPVFMRTAPFRDEKENVLGLIWNFTDIFDQKEAEKKILEYTRTIEEDLADKETMLEKARHLQLSFIQSSLPVLEEFSIHALFMPCEDLGGDFFHVMKGVRDNKLVIVLGDCTDHGIKASMDATLLSSLVNKYLFLLYAENRTDLFLKTISIEFMKIADEDQFPTIFAAVIDLDGNEMFYSNANSELPSLIRKNKVTRLKKAAGMHIGYFDDPVYERKSFKFESGDRLLFYSDAIIEIEKPDHTRVGYEGLDRMLQQGEVNAMNNFEDLIARIEGENLGLPLNDDTTLIQIDFMEPVTSEYQFHELEKWHDYHKEIKADLYKHDYSTGEIEEFGIALDELCINAFLHGNRGDKNKTVTISGRIDCMKVEFLITDEGAGFDPDQIPDPSVCIEEIMERDIEDEYMHGRGVMMARNFVDSMEYNEKGNTVSIKKQKAKKKLHNYLKILPENNWK